MSLRGLRELDFCVGSWLVGWAWGGHWWAGRHAAALLAIDLHPGTLRAAHPCTLCSPPRQPTPAGITYDMHCVLDVDNEKHNQIAEDIWANAEVFDWRAEAVFKYIQVRAG